MWFLRYAVCTRKKQVFKSFKTLDLHEIFPVDTSLEAGGSMPALGTPPYGAHLAGRGEEAK